jgi:hypothetical protein
VDGIRIEQVVGSDQGVAGFLEGIQGALRTKTFTNRRRYNAFTFRRRNGTPSSFSNRGWKGSSSWRSTGRRRGWWTCGRRGQALDFLGYTFGWDRDRKGRDRRFLNVFRSKEGGSTGAGKAARDDEQSPVLQADSDSHWRAESAPEGMGKLLLLRVPSRRATERSTGT